MPHETTWCDQGICWRYYGQVTPAETRQANEEFYGDPRSDQALFQLVDLRDVSGMDYSDSDQALTAAIDGAASVVTPSVRVAFIVPDDRFDEALKFYLELINKTSWSARTFADPQAAMAWCERRGEDPHRERWGRLVLDR